MTKTMNRKADDDVASEPVDVVVLVTNRLIEKNVDETLRVDLHAGVLVTMTGPPSQSEVTATTETIVVPARAPMKSVKRVTVNHASHGKNVVGDRIAVHDNAARVPANQTVSLDTREMNTETNRSMNSTLTSTDSTMMSMPTTTTCVPNRIARSERDAIMLDVAGGPTVKSRLIAKNVADEDGVDGAEVVAVIATRKSQKTNWKIHKI